MRRGLQGSRNSMRLYVLIRKDLGPAYGAVQAGHAVAEFVLRCPELWKNNTLIYLGVDDDKCLRRWGERLDQRGIQWVGFIEPDIGNQMTAIATVCERDIFRELKKWTGEGHQKHELNAREK